MGQCRRKMQGGEKGERQKTFSTSSALPRTCDLGRVLQFLVYRPAHILLTLLPSI